MHHKVVTNLKNMCFLQNFETNFFLFLRFLGFQHKKRCKWLFRPAFGVRSTQTLVKIYNTGFLSCPCPLSQGQSGLLGNHKFLVLLQARLFTTPVRGEMTAISSGHGETMNHAPFIVHSLSNNTTYACVKKIRILTWKFDKSNVVV